MEAGSGRARPLIETKHVLGRCPAVPANVLHDAVLPMLFDLCELISCGELTIAQSMIARGVDVNRRGRQGCEARLGRRADSEAPLAKPLLGAEAREGGDLEPTPLHVACKSGCEGLVKLLIEKGADIHARADWGFTALHLACESGHERIAALLLDNGAEVDAPAGQDAPLHVACAGGHKGIVKLLLERGAEVDAQNCEKITPLILACRYAHEATAKLLLDHGADVFVPDTFASPLHAACESGHEGVVKLLLDRGAEVSSEYCEGRTPLMVACDGAHAGIVELLLMAGAYLGLREFPAGCKRRAFLSACAHQLGFGDVVERLQDGHVSFVSGSGGRYGPTPKRQRRA